MKEKKFKIKLFRMDCQNKKKFLENLMLLELVWVACLDILKRDIIYFLIWHRIFKKKQNLRVLSNQYHQKIDQIVQAKLYIKNINFDNVSSVLI